MGRMEKSVVAAEVLRRRFPIASNLIIHPAPLPFPGPGYFLCSANRLLRFKRQG